jgi:phosphonoacetate hydrolase
MDTCWGSPPDTHLTTYFISALSEGWIKMMPRPRIVVGMMDGLGLEYVAQSEMPIWKMLAAKGFSKTVSAVMPSVTNVNNVSIATSCFPKDHGISGNSYYDAKNNVPVYMNSADLIQTPTIFQKAKEAGVKSGLLTSKRKTVELFSKHTEVAIAAECPPDEYIEKYGTPANIYSSEINQWLWTVAVDWLTNRPDLGLIYVHTTDYPMHAWPPEDERSKSHLTALDTLIGKAIDAAPDAGFFLTADHGMNFKTRCWDLFLVCKGAGTPIKFSLSPERDYYVKHHNNYAGCAYVYLNDSEDEPKVLKTLSDLPGVLEVLSRNAAAERFSLPPSTIGDLVVLADKTTMFGDLQAISEELSPTYRNHGSVFEMEVPLIIYNMTPPLPENEYQVNKDLLRGLFV